VNDDAPEVELNDQTGRIRAPTTDELAAELLATREQLAIARTRTDPMPLDATPGDRKRIEERLDKVCQAAEIDRGTTATLVLLVAKLRFVAGVSLGVSMVSLVVAVVRLLFTLSARARGAAL
jgi:hypothetical protein